MASFMYRRASLKCHRAALREERKGRGADSTSKGAQPELRSGDSPFREREAIYLPTDCKWDVGN